jgi:hypothetical protein
VLAEGNLYEIRRLIDHHPHRIRVECDRPRELAAALAGADHVRRLSRSSAAVVIETERARPLLRRAGHRDARQRLELRA